MARRVIRMTAAEVPSTIGSMPRDMLWAIRRGTNAGAQRGRAFIVKKTPTDQGQLRASWEVHRGTERRPTFRIFRAKSALLASLKNTAPHAGIVELGARPHPVSEEGIQALARWAMRNISFKTPADNLRRARRVAIGPRELPMQGPRQRPKDRRFAHALQIARGIAWKIRHHGQKPTYFVRDNMETLTRLMAREVNRELDKLKPRRPRGPRKAGP